MLYIIQTNNTALGAYGKFVATKCTRRNGAVTYITTETDEIFFARQVKVLATLPINGYETANVFHYGDGWIKAKLDGVTLVHSRDLHINFNFDSPKLISCASCIEVNGNILKSDGSVTKKRIFKPGDIVIVNSESNPLNGYIGEIEQEHSNPLRQCVKTLNPSIDKVQTRIFWRSELEVIDNINDVTNFPWQTALDQYVKTHKITNINLLKELNRAFYCAHMTGRNYITEIKPTYAVAATLLKTSQITIHGLQSTKIDITCAIRKYKTSSEQSAIDQFTTEMKSEFPNHQIYIKPVSIPI